MVQLTFVLIRGLARGNAHWLEFPALLKAKFTNSNVVSLEIPGNGERSSEMTPIDPMVIINDFRDTILKNHSVPVCLVGVSLGGMLALKWAETYPNDIKKVFILNSSLSQLSNPFFRLRPSAYAAVFMSLVSREKNRREKIILELISNLKSQDQDVAKKFVEISEQSSTTVSNFFRQLILANRIRIFSRPRSEIFLLASKKDKMVSFQCSVALSNFLSAQYFIHETAGHDLTLDDSDWVIEKMMSCIGV